MANVGPTAVPPPPPPPTALPPPPPPRARRPLLLAGAAGLVVGVLASIGVVAITGDDDPSSDVVATDDTSGDQTAPARTDAETEASPPTTTGPLADPTYVTLASVLYPDDVSALRQMLDHFDFPAWWWLPDSVAPAGDPFSTVQSVVAEDSLLDDGVSVAGAFARSTTFYLPTTDLATVEAAVVASVPTDQFDVEEGKARRSATENSGRSEVTYVIYAPDTYVNTLYVNVKQVGPYDATTADGIEVNMRWDVQVERPPSQVPTGPGNEKSFLSAAPVAGFMRWSSTELSVTTVRGIGAGGSYTAWMTAPGDEFDKTISFLTDSENFPGRLKLVQPGQFTTPEFWQQPMAWDDFLGSYNISKPSTGSVDNLLFSLEFPLT